MSQLEKFVLAFCIVIGLTLAGGVGYKFGKHDGYKSGYKDGLAAIESKTDTIWRTDTHYVDKPVPYYVKPSGVEMYPIGTLAELQSQIDSLLAVEPDTTFIEIPVPMETKTYKDSTYSAQVTGFKATLDWIEVYPKTAYITNTIVERRHWGASVTAGPAVVYNGKWYAGLGAAIGLSYNF